MSSSWRAYTDLFVDPYQNWIDWRSGLGECGRLLYGLARATTPAVVVEIGSSRGKSTCCFALACLENGAGHVYAIDPHTENNWSDTGTGGSTFEFLHDRLRTYGLERHCSVIRKTSQEAAAVWDKPIDLLFIDGDHTFEGVRTDFEVFDRWLNPNALVVFHDSLWEHFQPWSAYGLQNSHPGEMGVPRYLAHLQSQGYESVTMPPVPGLTIMRPRSGGFDFLRGLATSSTRQEPAQRC